MKITKLVVAYEGRITFPNYEGITFRTEKHADLSNTDNPNQCYEKLRAQCEKEFDKEALKLRKLAAKMEKARG